MLAKQFKIDLIHPEAEMEERPQIQSTEILDIAPGKIDF